MGALALRPADLREFEGEARVPDTRLSEVLGYDRPRKIRDIIRRYGDELTGYGVLPQVGAKPLPGSVGGRPECIFMLNEAQAVLVAMFSRTERAAQVRQQIVQVFLAWRHGKLAPKRQVAPETRAMEGLVQRIELLERAMGSRAMVADPDFARTLPYTPAFFKHRRGDGDVSRQRFPKFWGDLEVRQALIEMHRQMTIDQVICVLREKFGEERVPSRSSIGRFFKDYDKNWNF